jgi:CTP:phosphocholine cytidylyltransferase-like protein
MGHDIMDKKTYHVNWIFTDSLVTMEYVSPKMIKICKEYGGPTTASYSINKVTKVEGPNGWGATGVYFILDDKQEPIVRITTIYNNKEKTYSVSFESKDTFTNQTTKITYFTM